jgi:hypothetical protein
VRTSWPMAMFWNSQQSCCIVYGYWHSVWSEQLPYMKTTSVRPSVYDPVAAAELLVRLSWISLCDFLTENVCVISSVTVILCPRV